MAVTSQLVRAQAEEISTRVGSGARAVGQLAANAAATGGVLTDLRALLSELHAAAMRGHLGGTQPAVVATLGSLPQLCVSTAARLDTLRAHVRDLEPGYTDPRYLAEHLAAQAARIVEAVRVVEHDGATPAHGHGIATAASTLTEVIVHLEGSLSATRTSSLTVLRELEVACHHIDLVRRLVRSWCDLAAHDTEFSAADLARVNRALAALDWARGLLERAPHLILRSTTVFDGGLLTHRCESVATAAAAAAGGMAGVDGGPHLRIA